MPLLVCATTQPRQEVRGEVRWAVAGGGTAWGLGEVVEMGGWARQGLVGPWRLPKSTALTLGAVGRA